MNDWLKNNSDLLLAVGGGLLGGRTAQDQIGGLASNVGTYARDKKQRNVTTEWLQKNSPELLPMLEAGMSPGDLLAMAYKQKRDAEQAQLKAQEPSYMAVGKNLFNKRTGEWMAPPAGVAGGDDGQEYGLTPQYGVDANGTPVLLQLSKGGTSKQTALPDGVSLSKEPIKLDAGTHFVLLDPITRQPVGQIPKDLAGAERDKEIGTAEGKSIAAASGDMQAGQNAKDLVRSIRDDPNREWGTGKSSMMNGLPGTGGFDFQRKVEQAKSGAFMTAIQQMRGLGALSNSEGQTATAAVTRMDTAMTEEGFLEALADYERIIDQGIARAQGRMGQIGGAGGPQQGGNRTQTGATWRIK